MNAHKTGATRASSALSAVEIRPVVSGAKTE